MTALRRGFLALLLPPALVLAACTGGSGGGAEPKSTAEAAGNPPGHPASDHVAPQAENASVPGQSPATTSGKRS